MKKILFLFFLSFIICEEIVGDYKRRSFKENSADIEITYNVAQKAAKSFFKINLNTTSNFTIYPLSVFSQTVKGTNFKYVFASLDVYGVVTVLTTTIYLDLDNTAQFKSAEVAEEYVEKLKLLEELHKFKSVEAIKKIYDGKFKDSRIITAFRNILFEDAGDELYFLQINSEEGNYAFVYRDPKRNYNAEYIIKNFKILYEISE